MIKYCPHCNNELEFDPDREKTVFCDECAELWYIEFLKDQP